MLGTLLRKLMMQVRLEIFRTLLSLRANSDYHLGLTGGGTSYNFSPCLVCERQPEEEGGQGGGLSPVPHQGLHGRHEVPQGGYRLSWALLVLEQIPTCLQNKGMITW